MTGNYIDYNAKDSVPDFIHWTFERFRENKEEIKVDFKSLDEKHYGDLKVFHEQIIHSEAK